MGYNSEENTIWINSDDVMKILGYAKSFDLTRALKNNCDED